MRSGLPTRSRPKRMRILCCIRAAVVPWICKQMTTCTPLSRATLAITILLIATSASRAEDIVWATGRVLDSSGTRPVPGAVVAVYDAKNRVVDYVKTDANGEYALAIPKSALNLPRRRGGFLHQVSKTVNSAVSSAGGLIGAPIKAGIRAAASAAGGTDPLTRAGIGAAAGVVSNIVDIVTGSGATRRALERSAPGVVTMRVYADGHEDVAGLSRVYWMQEEVYRVGGGEQRAMVAWLDPVRLGSAGGGRSVLSSDLLCFTEARVSPAIVERGQEVTLSVTFHQASDPRTPVVIVARNSRTGQMYELERVGPDRYACRFMVDKRNPLNDQILTVIAYAGQDTRPGRLPDVERALLRSGLWDPGRRFVYNPLLVAGRNRVEVTLTVVEPPRRR